MHERGGREERVGAQLGDRKIWINDLLGDQIE